MGTSIPGFLSHLAPRQIGLENEYSWLALEQSPLGLLLWVSFILWVVAGRRRPVSPEWRVGTRIIWANVTICWATAFIGVGMLTAIPGTPILLFGMGMLARSDVPRPFSGFGPRRRCPARHSASDGEGAPPENGREMVRR